MQKAGSVVCHMLRELQLPMKVLFVDTGVHFAETLITRDRIAREYNLDIVTLSSPADDGRTDGPLRRALPLDRGASSSCCHMRKTEPLLAVRGQFDALIGSLRRSEGGQRSKIPIIAIDPEMNCVRVNVLAMFTNEQMKEYIEQHNVIINPLHSQGYTTIGCNRCTTPVLPGEPPRAGRWRHLGPWSMYCGINPDRLRPRRDRRHRPLSGSRRPHPRPPHRLRHLNQLVARLASNAVLKQFPAIVAPPPTAKEL